MNILERRINSLRLWKADPVIFSINRLCIPHFDTRLSKLSGAGNLACYASVINFSHFPRVKSPPRFVIENLISISAMLSPLCLSAHFRLYFFSLLSLLPLCLLAEAQVILKSNMLPHHFWAISRDIHTAPKLVGQFCILCWAMKALLDR